MICREIALDDDPAENIHYLTITNRAPQRHGPGNRKAGRLSIARDWLRDILLMICSPYFRDRR